MIVESPEGILSIYVKLTGAKPTFSERTIHDRNRSVILSNRKTGILNAALFIEVNSNEKGCGWIILNFETY